MLKGCQLEALSKGGVLFSLRYMPTAATSSVALAVKLTLAELVKLSLPAVPSNEKAERLWRGSIEPGDVIREGLGDVACLVLEAHLDLAFSIQRTTQGEIGCEVDVV